MMTIARHSLNCVLAALSISLIGCSNAEIHPGQAIWETNCSSCHGTGLAGAPIIGNVKAWEKRLTRGKESLYGHALNGWGDMPARGGNPNLSDAEVKAAVDYMTSKVE